MHRTIVALYDTRSDAEVAVRDLEADGFDRSATEIITHAEAVTGIGSAAGQDYIDTDYARQNSGGFLTRLTSWNVPERDAHVYAEGVRRGGALLKLRVDDDDVDRAVAVLERGNVVDVEQREAAYRTTGWSGYDETAAPYDETTAAEERARHATGLSGAAQSFRDVNTTDTTYSDSTARRGVDVDREEVIPVAEEKLDIGKRAVEGGVVRVRTYVTETPVNETVNLRQEHVHVERRAVDRAVDDLPEDAFREREIEVRETAEEAVVQKRAHVTEEVVIRKDVEERAQNVSDTVRRTEVEIDDGRTGTDRPLRRDDDLER
ncbi:YsnF/AvaK domain-containing protein [Azospirillum sp.]|uniref:YsnF/AvaK domain-containing protein n=1 Tax=Azospirillum sp. TaxID=34012 RepID=UPI003D7135A6